MKALIIFITIFCINWDEGIIREIKGQTSKNESKELITELKEVFKKVQIEFEKELNLEDTLYIIRGIDIQNRNTFGRIWNNNFKIHYRDDKLENQKKLMFSVPKISKNENYTSDFDGLVKYIENNDSEVVINYSIENKVLSGIHWVIMTFKKNEKKDYESNLFTISDFSTLKN